MKNPFQYTERNAEILRLAYGRSSTEAETLARAITRATLDNDAVKRGSEADGLAFVSFSTFEY